MSIRSRKKELADIDYDGIKHRTEKAILFIINGEEVWIPKWAAEIDEDEKTVMIPHDMALEKGLI